MRFYYNCYCILFLGFSIINYSQAQTQIEFAIPEPQLISIDQNDNLFLTDSENNLYKYDTTGVLQLNYAPEKMGTIHSLEAGLTQQIFLFYQDLQEIVWLDRFLRPISQFSIDFNLIGYARLATPSADFKIWLIDESDFTLKKYDLEINEIIVSTPLDLLLNPKSYQIIGMKEYQNRLYVLDKNQGIVVFDAIGNYVETMKIPITQNISFKNENLYFLDDEGICYSYGLYSQQKQKVLSDSIQNIEHLIIGNKFWYGLRGNVCFLIKSSDQ